MTKSHFSLGAFLLTVSLGLASCQPAKPITEPEPASAAQETSEPSASELVFTAQVADQTALALTEANTAVEYKEYDFGAYVTAVGGQTAPSGYFWSLYHNGQKATLGASELLLKANDTIEWKLEKVEATYD